MSTVRRAGERITGEVESWPGVDAGLGRRGEFAFTLGGREFGHLHGDRAAHFFFPRDIWLALRRSGRIVEHPVFPGREGPAARLIGDEADVRGVIELLRLGYDRVAERQLARRGAAAGSARGSGSSG